MNLALVLARRHYGNAPVAPTEETTMQSTIHVFKLDEVKKGISKKSGQPYEIHTAQTALIDVAGNVDTVGVLDIPPDLRGKVNPGRYTATFAMKTNFMTGRIEAALVGLLPIVDTKAVPAAKVS